MKTLLLAVAGSALLGSSVTPVPTSSDEPLSMTLTKVREVRHLDVGDHEEDGFRMFSSSPGLFADFLINIPEGAKVLGIVQPEEFKAFDSTGKDLSDVEPDFWGNPAWLETDTFSDTPKVTLKLTPSARAATTFSAKGEGKVRVSFGLDPHDVEQKTAWTPFEHPALKKMNAAFRFKKDADDEWASLEVRPTEARDLIASIVPAADDAEPQGYSVSYNDKTASFSIESPAAGQKIRLFLHKDMKELPVVIDLKDQPLP